MNLEPHKIFDVLSNNNVPYVVIGGHAVNYYGYIRATEDFDIIFHRTEESEKLLFKALSALNAYWITNEIDHSTGLEKTKKVNFSYISSNHLMMLGTDYGYLDIFDFIPGFENENVEILLKEANSHNNINFISFEWLKKIKKQSNRPKDLLDLENLEK